MTEINEKWRSAIQASNLSQVAELLSVHPELVLKINDPVFAFDSPAIFQVRENLELVDLLLSHGANINQKSAWWAGGFGILEDVSPEIAQPLIDRGALVDIWAAVGLNRIQLVTELLEQSPDLINARGGDGKLPLHYCVSPEMVDLLIAGGAEVGAKCVDHGSTAVQYQVNNLPVARRLLEHGAQPDVFIASAWGDEQILDECRNLNRECCDCRLGCADWNSQAGGHIYHWKLGHGVTPFQVARRRGHHRMVESLLERASTASNLMDAIDRGDSECAENLLTQFPRVLNQLTDDNRQALARAAWWYNPDAVRLMLKFKFDPHVAGVHDSTPLDRAAFHGYADIVSMLLKGDPDPPIHRKNEFGGTPLGACLHGYRMGWETGHPQDHLTTVQLLIAAGSKVTHADLGSGSDAIDSEITSAIARISPS